MMRSDLLLLPLDPAIPIIATPAHNLTVDGPSLVAKELILLEHLQYKVLTKVLLTAHNVAPLIITTSHHHHVPPCLRGKGHDKGLGGQSGRSYHEQGGTSPHGFLCEGVVKNLEKKEGEREERKTERS